MYVRIRAKAGGFTEWARDKATPTTPIIVSSLFRHERKVSMCHARVKIHNENLNDDIDSRADYEIHSGFRRFKTNITYSRIYKRCDKFKFVRKVADYDTWYLASFYSQIYFPAMRLTVLSLDQNGNPRCISLAGDLLYPDPLLVILKRIILTGYPTKVKIAEI